MKNLLALLTLIVLITSCKKNTVTPSTTASSANEEISVEYRIHAASGNFTFSYTQPDANGSIETISGEVAKSDKSFFITWKKNQMLTLKARNLDPSASEVTVEIYANGNYIAGGNANNANAWAIAEGIAK